MRQYIRVKYSDIICIICIVLLYVCISGYYLYIYEMYNHEA